MTSRRILIPFLISAFWFGCLGERPPKTGSGPGAQSGQDDSNDGDVDYDDDEEGGPPKPTGPSIIDRGIAADCVGTDVALVDNAEDGDGTVASDGGRDGIWYAQVDKLGSTIQPSKTFKMSDGGASGTKRAAHVKGNLAADSKAWAMVGVSLLSDAMYDATKFKGISFYAKVTPGSTTTARLMIPDGNTTPDGGVCKECHNHFGKDVTFSTEWKKYTVLFDELAQQPTWGDKFPKLNREQIVGAHWALVENGMPFDLWLDEVELLCEAVEKG